MSSSDDIEIEMNSSVRRRRDWRFPAAVDVRRFPLRRPAQGQAQRSWHDHQGGIRRHVVPRAARRGGTKSGGDDLVSELEKHVQVDGSVLDRYQGTVAWRWTVSVWSWPCSAYQMIRMLWQKQSERDGAIDGFMHAVAGFAYAGNVLDIEARGLYRPPRRVAGDDLFGCGGEVGGDQRDAVNPWPGRLSCRSRAPG